MTDTTYYLIWHLPYGRTLAAVVGTALDAINWVQEKDQRPGTYHIEGYARGSDLMATKK